MIRKLEENDLNSVLEIWLESNIEAHNFIPDTYWKSQVNNVKELLPQAEVYVYESNNEILGFIGLSENNILGLFVSLESQSKGIGRSLIKYTKELKVSLILSVYENIKNAFEFYKRQGFSIVSDSYDDSVGEVEYIMTWTL